ncbi:hypothetical protein ElyMa_004919700 [Elysia marginata]|uniref:Endonuclease/exonuclease/phosphatase domain-containing protein n=1 Tax=Elysia marginata TaxID=1093978 RepID=A0AAV4IXR1_9GAST|nr:hypothetical protein ElyMa_004919700 [Elysia marginata]
MRDILRTHLLSQVVNTPTQKKNHILDWVVTPDIDLINNLQVMDKCISDHKVIVFELPYCKPKLVKRTITCRTKNIDNQALGTDIQRAAEDMKNDYTKNLVDTTEN